MLKRQAQIGVSLVELLIGVAVGLFVIWGMSSVYINSVQGSRVATNASELNQDLRAVMDIMVNDIRRAGYWSGSAPSTANPFATSTTMPVITGSAGANCIIYSYDATYNGSAGAVAAGTDFFGYQLASGALQTVDQANSTGLGGTTTACSSGTISWQNLTDERAMTITALTIDQGGSQCIEFVPSTYDPVNSATYVAWTTAAGTTAAACTAAGFAAASSVAPTGAAYPAANGTNTYAETRQVNITITATSKLDPTLTATLSDTALVRNNRITTSP